MPRDKTGHFYYSWFPTIFQQDTQQLTLAEDGAYRRLIDHYMLTRAPLPSDDRALARIAAATPEEWATLKTQLVSYFKPEGNRLRHTFCDDMLSADAERIKTSRSNGGKGGRPRGSKTKRITQAVSEAEPNGNPVGLPKTELNKTELEEKKPPSEAKKTVEALLLPTWLPNEDWDGFVEMRRRIRKPLTQYAAKLALAKLERFRSDGHDALRILRESTMSSYQGLFLPGEGRSRARPETSKPQKENVRTL